MSIMSQSNNTPISKAKKKQQPLKTQSTKYSMNLIPEGRYTEFFKSHLDQMRNDNNVQSQEFIDFNVDDGKSRNASFLGNQEKL